MQAPRSCLIKLSKTKQFLITAISFAILGAVFKVMVLVPGFTEIRPGNAIPIVAGLAFGSIGGLGCAVGNLVADMFGTFGWTSILGVISNFVAAYLPYKLWHLCKNEAPNVHTWKNIALYIWLSLISALTVAWILGYGLDFFMEIWLENIYLYVFYNNFGFSIILGLPLFIVFTSDSIQLEMKKISKKRGTKSGTKRNLISLFIAILYTILMLIILIAFFANQHLSNSNLMKLLSLSCLVLLLYLCLVPVYKDEKN